MNYPGTRHVPPFRRTDSPQRIRFCYLVRDIGGDCGEMGLVMARKFPNMPKGGGAMNVNAIKKMQEDMLKMQDEMQEREFSATVGGGIVTAVVNGKHELIKIEIDPEALDPADVEMLQDMIVAAVGAANSDAERTANDEMSKLTGGLSLPGLF